MNPDVLAVSLSAVALIVSVVAVVLTWRRTQLALKRTEILEHDFEDRKRRERRAELRVELNADVLRVENRGEAKARNIRFRMDGLTVQEHHLLATSRNEHVYTELEAGDIFEYYLYTSPGNLASLYGLFEVKIAWEDDSGEARERTTLLKP